MATRKKSVDDMDEPGVALVVTARRDGFRRCGLAFGKHPVELTVSQKDAAILMAEPMLDVAVVAAE